MQTHRFGKKIKLPSTIAIRHQLRTLMLEDLVKKVEEAALQCGDVSALGGNQVSDSADLRRRA
jgi:hypothetical protein